MMKSRGWILVFSALAAMAFHVALCLAADVRAEPPAPARECEVSPLRELGEWNAIHVFDDRDFIVLRRDDTLFSLEMKLDAEPVKLMSNPMLRCTEIIDGVCADGRLWLLMQSKSKAPFAIDAYSGLPLKFDIPGRTFALERFARIGNYAFIPGADALILKIETSSAEMFGLWRKRRDLCFLLDLKTGAVTQFPESWRIDCLTKDMRIAIFNDSDSRRTVAFDLVFRRPLGEASPEQRKISFVRFHEAKEPAWPVYSSSGSGVEGALVDGSFVSFDALGRVELCSRGLQRKDGFIALNLCKGTNAPVRILPLKGGPVEDGPAIWMEDFLLLGHGNCIYRERGRGESFEAFFREHGSGATWNLLSGVGTTPVLGSEDEHIDRLLKSGELNFPEGGSSSGSLSYDRMDALMYGCFGSDGANALALCRFSRFAVPKSPIPYGVAFRIWDRYMLVDSSGRRFIARLPKMPDMEKLRLHNSGLLLVSQRVFGGGQAEAGVKLSLLQWTLPKD